MGAVVACERGLWGLRWSSLRGHTALRARCAAPRHPPRGRSDHPAMGRGGASGGAAPAEHTAVAARAPTATLGCYNPRADVGRAKRALPKRWPHACRRIMRGL